MEEYLSKKHIKHKDFLPKSSNFNKMKHKNNIQSHFEIIREISLQKEASSCIINYCPLCKIKESSLEFYTLQCGHKFHYNCILTHSNSSDEATSSSKRAERLERENFNFNHSLNLSEDKYLICFTCQEKDPNIFHKNSSGNDIFYIAEEIHELASLEDMYRQSLFLFEIVILLWLLFAVYFLLVKTLVPAVFSTLVDFIYFCLDIMS